MQLVAVQLSSDGDHQLWLRVWSPWVVPARGCCVLCGQPLSLVFVVFNFGADALH